MSDTKFFRQYLDVLNEGPPPGIGPNAPVRPATQQQFGQPDTFTKMLPGMGNKALDAGKGLVDPYAKTMTNFTPGSPYYQQNVANNPAVKAKVDAFMQTAPSAGQLGADVDATKQAFNQALTAKPTAGGTSTEYEKAAGQTGLPVVPAPTNEETDDMDEGKLMRKYMDFLDEAPAQAINPNDPNAAAFGKTVNAPVNQNRVVATQTTPNPKLAAINQQVAKASNVVDPNQKYGGGYDPTKVQYAAGPGSQQAVNNQSSGYTAQSQAQKTAPASPAASATQSAALDASKANAIGGNKQATAPTFTGMAGSQTATNTQAAAPQPNLASQYVSANQPQSATITPTASSTPKAAPEPSLASQYVQANQPQAVAEEENDSDDELLKSIIRLIKK